MGADTEYAMKLTDAELMAERDEFQAKIDGPENDGRQTSDSSAWLDYWMDKVESLNKEIKRRGINA